MSEDLASGGSTLTESRIHPTAIIDPSAELGAGVDVGPWVVIGPQCTVGDGTRIAARATLERNVRLGQRVQIGIGAVELHSRTAGSIFSERDLRPPAPLGAKPSGGAASA